MQATLTGDEADPCRISLTEAEPKVWDDGDKTPLWHCPQCDCTLCADSTCPECGWFDSERWDITLRRSGGQRDG